MRQNLKGQDMLLEKNGKFGEFSIWLYTQNRKLGYLGKRSVTSNFDSYCNLIFRNDKNELRQKILSFTQNRKIGNLGKVSFNSDFYSSCNLFQICIF